MDPFRQISNDERQNYQMLLVSVCGYVRKQTKHTCAYFVRKQTKHTCAYFMRCFVYLCLWEWNNFIWHINTYKSSDSEGGPHSTFYIYTYKTDWSILNIPHMDIPKNRSWSDNNHTGSVYACTRTKKRRESSNWKCVPYNHVFALNRTISVN